MPTAGSAATRAKRPGQRCALRLVCSGRIGCAAAASLTRRSTGPATAAVVSPACATRTIVAVRAYAACLRRPVSSNVRPRLTAPSQSVRTPRRGVSACWPHHRRLRLTAASGQARCSAPRSGCAAWLSSAVSARPGRATPLRSTSLFLPRAGRPARSGAAQAGAQRAALVRAGLTGRSTPDALRQAS